MRITRLILLAFLSLAVVRCASTGGTTSSSSIEDDDDDEDENQEDEDDVISGQVGGSTTIYTYSLSNSPLSSKRFSPRKAKGLIRSVFLTF